MAFYNNAESRFIFLIEQLRVALSTKDSIETIIKNFSVNFSEFNFLKDVSDKLDSGKKLNEALTEQISQENSKKIKGVLDALNSGDFAFEKLGDIRAELLREQKEDFEKVASGIMGKIGWLSLFVILPIAVYFLSTMAEVFKSVGFTSLVIGDSAKMLTVSVCTVLFVVFLFSKRLKNG